MTLSLGLFDSGLYNLPKGAATCILSNNYPDGGPWVYATNVDNTYPANNISMYFAAHGGTSLFDFLVAGEYLSFCADSRFYNIYSPMYWMSGFFSDYKLTSSFVNSFANKWLIDATTVTKANFVAAWGTAGEIPDGTQGYSHKLRFNIQVPQTTNREYTAGSIDAVYVYTYTT
jgi:hypothetical protein